MEITRIINSAHQLAHANGIDKTAHVDQIIGAMIRKHADGLSEPDVYQVGRTEAKLIADRLDRNTAINQLIDSIKTHGNPLIAANQAL